MKAAIALLAVAALAAVVSVVFALVSLQERRLRRGLLVWLGVLIGSASLFAVIGGGDAL